MRRLFGFEEDVLSAAKDRAPPGVSVGKAVSDLLRHALRRGRTGATRRGVPLFPVSDESETVTPELVSRLRGEAP